MRRQRPTGVTIIAVLAIIVGILSLLGGLLVVAASAFVGAIASPVGGAVLVALGSFLVLIGLIFLVAAYGFWKGTKWGWWVGIIATALSLIGSVVSLATGNFTSVVSLLIDLLLLYYLTRAHVKAWFHEMPGT